MEYKHKKEDAQRESGRALNKAQYLLENFKRGKAVAYSEYDKIDIDLADGYTALGLAYAQLALTYNEKLK